MVRFMVRRKIEVEEQKVQAVQMRVSPDEKQVLMKAAAKAGIGLSTWLRALALKEARRLGVK
jgi:uncharacterized protein (DUF1778 family)